MAKTTTLALLVNSLSKAEKRYFKLLSGLQSGNKNYFSLFEILEKKQYAKHSDIKLAFKKKHPEASFEITGKYLYRLLMDALLHLKNDEADNNTKIYTGLAMVKILFDRSLYHEGFQELEKLKKSAQSSGNSMMELVIGRLELDYISQLNFQEINEKELIQSQMKIGSLLKSISHTQMHRSLLDLLRHRLIHKGNARTEKQKEDLNDLVFSELDLMSKSTSNTYESLKTHLLFQSNYCISVGDYKSALKTFYELDKLLENNRFNKTDAAMDDLISLEGILDSLHTMKKYGEMDFYLMKIYPLQYPSPIFHIMKQRLIYLYKMISFTDRGYFTDALNVVAEMEDQFLRQVHILGFNRHAELNLYISLVYFCNKQWDKAIKYLNEILLDSNSHYKLQEYKTLRLMRLLVHHELENYTFINYEISAFKRLMDSKDKTYKLEKLIFKFLQGTQRPLTDAKTQDLWQKLKPGFEALSNDKFEIQMLKIFDFPLWIEAKLFKRDFSELVKKKKS